jgi:hypothetical protein
VECMYTLMTFGIPVDKLPLSDNQELKNQQHLKWIGLRRSLESGKAKSFADKAVLLPTHYDVLFGRGKPIQENLGNLWLGLVVESVFSRYDGASRAEKFGISVEIVNKVKGAGGRFLRQVSGIWMEADDDMAREKVSITFRSIRSVRKDSKQADTTVDSESDYSRKRALDM